MNKGFSCCALKSITTFDFWGHAARLFTGQPITEHSRDPRSLFRGDTGLLWWPTLAQGLPDSLAWIYFTLYNGLGCFHPHAFSCLLHSKSCIHHGLTALRLSPIPSLWWLISCVSLARLWYPVAWSNMGLLVTLKKCHRWDLHLQWVISSSN